MSAPQVSMVWTPFLVASKVNQMSVKPSRLTQEPSWKPESMSPVVSNGLPPAAAGRASAQVSPVGGGVIVSVPAPMSLVPHPSMWME